MVNTFTPYINIKINLLFFLIEENLGETNPEMIWVLLQTAASEMERSTEV